MCGIAGFLGGVHPSFLEKANQIQAHRGPDDEGIFFDQSSYVGLAHRRLSILDLSNQGHQPMSNESNTATLVFNGEIYNFRDLRKGLQKKGYSFQSGSDTEVLLRLYEDKGVSLLDDLNGIFSFAIWDHQAQHLFLARDGLGVKPLYYCENDKGFLFASELKVLAKAPEVNKVMNPLAIQYSLSYLWCPAPHTMVQSIKKCKPGEALIVKSGRIQKKWEFYDLPYGKEKENLSEREWSEQLRETLQKVVKRQMVSDVPVGAFLSGGLDSSALVAFGKSEALDQKMPCFTIGFENSNGTFDGFLEDLPYAKRVSEALGVPLHVVTVGPEIISEFEKIIYYLDEPQADIAPLNAYFICKLAKEHGIKVLLSGTGGDDLFSGYRRHRALQAEQAWSWLPLRMRTLLKKMTAHFPQNTSWGRRLERAFRYADQDEITRLMGYFLWIEENTVQSLFSKNLRESLSKKSVMEPLRKSLDSFSEKDPLHRMLFLEVKHFLADHNLNYMDKMGMAHGVEVRVPFLDKELVELATQMPSNIKQKGSTGKYIFKRSMEPILSKEVIYRPKSGFGAPLRSWLHGPLKEVVEDLLSESRIKSRGFFEPKAIRKLIDSDRSGKVDGAYPILALMCVEWWQRIFIDESG